MAEQSPRTAQVFGSIPNPSSIWQCSSVVGRAASEMRVAGSSPVIAEHSKVHGADTPERRGTHAGVAQLVEHRFCTPMVAGSTPVTSSTRLA